MKPRFTMARALAVVAVLAVAFAILFIPVRPSISGGNLPWLDWVKDKAVCAALLLIFLFCPIAWAIMFKKAFRSNKNISMVVASVFFLLTILVWGVVIRHNWKEQSVMSEKWQSTTKKALSNAELMERDAAICEDYAKAMRENPDRLARMRTSGVRQIYDSPEEAEDAAKEAKLSAAAYRQKAEMCARFIYYHSHA